MHILNAIQMQGCKIPFPKKHKVCPKQLYFIPQVCKLDKVETHATHVLRSSVQLSGVPRSPIAAKVAPRLGAALMLHALVVSSEQLLAWLHVLVRVRGLGLGLEVGLRSAEVSGKGQG